MCYNYYFLLFVSQISNKAKKKKTTCLHCSEDCFHLFRLHLFPGTVKRNVCIYCLLLSIFTSRLEQCVKNGWRIFRYCLCLRMIVAFYFSDRDESIIINIVCTVIYISSANTVVSLILVVPTLPTGACRGCCCFCCFVCHFIFFILTVIFFHFDFNPTGPPNVGQWLRNHSSP